MCFFHAGFDDSITRADAMKRLAALGALPIMPSMSPVPNVHDQNAGREYTAIVGATAFVGDDLTPLHDSLVLLRGNKIEAVGPRDSAVVPSSALVIDASGRYAIPGLVDSHVHFFQSGGLYTRPDAIDLRSVRPYTDELQWIRANLQDTFARYLRAGITSVVDVGGPFWNYDVRAMSQQTLAAPRVMAGGPLISSVDRSILDPYNDPPIVKIDTFEAARTLIDRELAANTDLVKFWWIVTPTHPAAAFQPVARPAIEYAHSRGARVIIHATELETARLAVESGTDILAHSVFDTDVDDAFVALLQSRKVIYCPTLLVVGNYGYTFHGTPHLTAVDLQLANPDVVGTLYNMQDVEGALSPALLTRIRALRVPEPPHAAMRNLKRVYDAGIRVAAGTDAGNIGTQHASSLYAELIAMVDSGLAPKQVLLTATRGGAELMARPQELGTIEAGRLADLVILRDDPTQNIRAVASVDRVIKDGHVFQTASILDERPEQIVQRQVNAFNHHDAGIFAGTYSANAAVVSHNGTTLRSRTAIQAAYRDAFAKNPQLHAEIVSRHASGESVVDEEHVTGFADGHDVRATVSYRVSAGSIVSAQIRSV